MWCSTPGISPPIPPSRGVTCETNVDLSLAHGEVSILGTGSVGEREKSEFAIMNYMPNRGIPSMHCSATVDPSARN